MDEFRYPLFFEAREDLTDREREKIRRHFLRRRLSGGGECGPIEKIGEKAYRVCFTNEEGKGGVHKEINSHKISFSLTPFFL